MKARSLMAPAAGALTALHVAWHALMPASLLIHEGTTLVAAAGFGVIAILSGKRSVSFGDRFHLALHRWQGFGRDHDPSSPAGRLVRCGLLTLTVNHPMDKSAS